MIINEFSKYATQDRGPFCFVFYILNKFLQDIEIWNEI